MKKILKCLILVLIASIAQLKAQTPTISITNLDTSAIQGMADQPVLKLNINTGTADNLTLQSLSIKSLCQDSTDIDSVAIYYTNKNNRLSFADYSNDIVTLLAKRKKFHKDSVVFNNLTFGLDTGRNYFWVVLNLSKTSKAGHYLNATIRAGGITINGTTYPATAPPSPAGQILIWQKYFTENFEKANGDGTPYGWQSRYYDSYKINWYNRQGGYGTPDHAGNGNPTNAKSGKTNARFAVGDIMMHSSMLFYNKPIDLSLSVKPLLVFYHAQIYNPLLSKQDTLSLYYQLLPDTTWRYMKGYQLATPTGTWVKRQIVLPDAMVGKKINLGFRAYANYGWGVCVDSIMIYETQSATRSVNDVIVSQPETGFVPQSSTDNPILRVDFKVRGNTGALTLSSFAVTSGNTSDAGDIANVKLYYTNDSAFISPVLVGPGSFSGGKATFSSLTRNLETGDNYYWIAYDIKSNAMPYNIVDASISANDIVTSGGNFPSTSQAPTGHRIIKQTIFWDDFETDKGWGLRGDFERDTPKGNGGTMGYPDPTKAYSGSKVIGNNLTGTGLYATGLTYATADTATSPLIQAKYFKNVKFNYYRWLNVFGEDSASIDIKYAGSNNWKTIWNNNRAFIVEGNWNLDSVSGGKTLFDRKTFRIRYRMGPTTIYQYSGWNVDNVFFTGDSVKWDVAVTKYLGPNSSCSLSAAEHFKVRVKNTGPKTLTNIPIKLSINGGQTWTTETIPGPVNVDDSLDYTFSTAKDLATPKIYNIIVKTVFPGDNYPDNDSITYSLTSTPTYTIPYQNGFEKDTSFWTSYGLNSSWLQSAPGGTYINFTPEGNNCWQTNWSGYFLPNENSYVESPCFKLTGDSIPIIDFKSSYVTSNKVDGTKIEYSLDGGATWTYLPLIASAYSWSWYNDTIHTFHGLKGWTGQSQIAGNQIWEHDKRIVSEIANENLVKFRFNFKSDSSTLYRTDGFAFDDFKLMNAPFDVGVTAINNLVEGANYCPYEKDGIVQLSVKNYGIRNMHANDTIIIGVKVDNQPVVIDTFKLTSAFVQNATKVFTMKHPVNIVSVGTHKIKAYTLIEKDPFFYSSTSNDADSISINIKPNPVTNLPVSYSSARPDTLQIKAYQGTNYIYSWEYGGSTVSTTYSVNVKNGAQIRTGDFHLTVTDNTPGNGCITYDTTTFNLLVSDAGVKSIIEPTTHCSYSATFKPIVRIKNFGTDTLQKNLVLPIQTRLTKGGIVGSLVADNYTLTNKLVPGDSVTITLNNIVNLTVPDSYTLMVRTTLPNDLVSINDSSVQSFQIYGNPTVELGPDIYSKTLSYTLPAPLGYNSYLWSDNSTNDTLIVTQSGKYVLTVTNTNGCATKDSVNVMLSIHDLSIKRVISPTSFCSKPGPSTISCKVMNNGTDTIKTSENPLMSYSLNGAAPVTQALALASNLLPGDSVTFTFNQKADIHLPSTNIFDIKTTIANDLRRANDSVMSIVKVYANPVINIGNDNIVHALQYKLSPGSNYPSYLWQDNSTDSTYTITQNHKNADDTYSVIVTDANGCIGGDTVHIYFYVDDLTLDSIDIPSQVCSQPFNIRAKVSNSGSETYVNKDLVIRYKVNDDPEVSEAFKYTGNPGNSSFFTFATPVTPTQMGLNKIKVTIEMVGDLRRSNDTLTRFLNILNGINIDFGAINDTLHVDVPYTLDAGSGTNYSYTWNTSANTQTISVSANGNYTVTVTDGSCTASKSVTIIDNVYDLSISGFTIGGRNLNLTDCRFTQVQEAGFEVQNTGSLAVSNQTITIKYQINSGTPVSKTVAFSGAKQAKAMFYFDDLIDLSQAAIDTFKLNLVYPQDEVTSNNSKSYLLNVLDKPTITFAGEVNDTIKTGTLPQTIDPGSGTNYTYKWYDGSTTRTISSNMERWQTVTVSNGYCTAMDSVYLRLVLPVLSITNIYATVQVYPNPVRDVLNINLSVKTNEDVMLELISQIGAVVKTGKLSGSTRYIQTLDVSDLPGGLYYLRIFRKDWVLIEKIIIR